MKKAIAFLLMAFTLAACSKPGSKLLDDISGVWLAQDGSMVKINSTEKGMFFVIGEKDIDVKLGETDEEQGTVNLNVTLNDGKPAIWTIKQIWDKEHKNFTLGFTLHDGTQDELSFVRKVSASEMEIIERNRASVLAASTPSITAATSAASTNATSAPSVAYEAVLVSDSDVGNAFTLAPREMGGSAINYQSRAGLVNVMEQVVEDPDLTTYVAVEKAYKFGDKYVLIVSTGENGASCPATTYAFTYDTKVENVSGKASIDGCSEIVDSMAEGNKLTVKKDGKASVFYNGDVK